MLPVDDHPLDLGNLASLILEPTCLLGEAQEYRHAPRVTFQGAKDHTSQYGLGL